MLSDEQHYIVDLWKSGHNIQTSAVCGSGKSTLLLACASVKQGCILLTYNKNLAKELQQKANRLSIELCCYTIHGLCSKLCGTCTDDYELEEYTSKLNVEDISWPHNISGVLLDESQDLRELYIKFIKKTKLVEKQLLIVGDPEQMIYDYDNDYPADSKFLKNPEIYLKETIFKKTILSKSFRINENMAKLANHITQPTVNIVSDKKGHKVDIYTIPLYNSATIIKKYLDQWGNRCCILTPTKNNNFKLAKVINNLSNYGFKIHIQGIDGEDPKTKENKIIVSTWHSSKGLEYDYCIVFGVNQYSEQRPLHVAITRSKRKLVIIQDNDSICVDLMRGLIHCKDNINCDANTTNHFLTSYPPAWSIPVRHKLSYDILNFEHKILQLPLKFLKEHIQVGIYKQSDDYEIFAPLIVCSENGTWESVTDIYILSILIKLEYERTNCISYILDIRSAKMLKSDDIKKKIKSNDRSRWNLNKLPNELSLKVRNYEHFMNSRQYCDIACALLATIGYQHRMMTLHQSKYWCDNTLFNELYKRIDMIQCDKFDYRLFCHYNDKILYTRCHAFDSFKNVTWQIIFNEDPEKEILNLAVQFFICGANTCMFINLTDGLVWELNCQNISLLKEIVFNKYCN